MQDRDGAAFVLDRITRRFPFLEGIFADAGYQGPRVAAAAPRPVEIIRAERRGISHNPREHTDDAELVAGANVLLDVVAEGEG